MISSWWAKASAPEEYWAPKRRGPTRVPVTIRAVEGSHRSDAHDTASRLRDWVDYPPGLQFALLKALRSDSVRAAFAT